MIYRNDLINFEWDPRKAESNLRKHTVSFGEAVTIFNDEMSITFSDPDHSKEEDRYITIGWSNRARLIMVSHTDRNKRIRIISARELTQSERKSNEEKTTEINDELRPEYDLKSLLKDGVHGKYTQTFRAWTNLILLKPDVAKAFPDEKAVNEALRLVMKLTKVQKDARPGARQ